MIKDASRLILNSSLGPNNGELLLSVGPSGWSLIFLKKDFRFEYWEERKNRRMENFTLLYRSIGFKLDESESNVTF